MAIQIQIRRDTGANWTSTNPLLAQGELGIELDYDASGVAFKVGDGVNNWVDLPYHGYSRNEIDSIITTISGQLDDHNELNNLDYASSGHTGFQPAGDYATNTTLTTVSGNIVDQIPTDFYTTSEVDGLITTISGKLDDHNELNNLDYASSGHTGFQPAGDYATNSILSTASGVLQSQITENANDITSVSGSIITDHSALSNLDYVSSGHTGFQPSGDYATNTALSITSGTLQSQIDNKSDVGHGHTESDISGLDKYTKSEVDALITTISGQLDDHNELNNLDYASSGHTGFQPAGDYATNTYVSTVSGSLQTNIDGKSDDGHGHTESDISDLDKYTQAEVDALITTISGQLDDHSELSGLDNDDHPQYLRTDGTRQLSGNWYYGAANISGTGNFFGDGSTLSGIAYIDGDDVYFYDTTRDKDLGVAIIEVGCGRNSANTTNQYLRTYNGAPMNLVGVALPVDATLVGMSASGGANNQTWTAQVGKNGVATVLDSITVTNSYENHSWDNDVDFSAGDRIQVYLSGTNINYPQVRLYFRRTK
jgi:aerobic-type carbon monoxide dehydrogenase small subunit (CoxS/CutS family)